MYFTKSDTRCPANGILWLVMAVSLVFQSCTFRADAPTVTTHQVAGQQTLFDFNDPGNKMPETAAEKEVDINNLLDEMTLREKIGQLFFIRARGYFKNVEDESYRALASKVKNYNLGGIVFFKGSIYGQAVLTNRLQELSDIPLWMTQDMEFGAAMRVEQTTRLTPAMGIAATQNPDYAYLAGKITAQEAKVLGVRQIFAPVLDVNNNPRNPVINVRSFSGNPDTVALYGQRFIDGVQSQRVVATAKHFPGHGDTDTDSHRALPVINHDYDRLKKVELAPFEQAINHGLQSVMSAHIAFPKISSNPQYPGTLDPSILNRILVDSLNFKGLVVTDGLEMRGISAHYSPGEAVTLALKAGADMMLLSLDEITAIQEVERAVERGEISEARIDRSVRKILEKKRQAGLFRDRKVDLEQLNVKIKSLENELIADEIARNSLTLLKNEGGILPITADKYPRVLVISVTDTDAEEKGTALVKEMRKYHPSVRHGVIYRDISSEDRSELTENVRWADLIVIGAHMYINSSGSSQFNLSQRRWLEQLPAQTPKALITFGNPYAVKDLPAANVQLLAWDGSDHQLENTAPALFGASGISGRLPINIPGAYDMNEGISLPQSTIRYDLAEAAGLSGEKLYQVDQLMHEAIFDSTFPGGIVTVLKDGIVAYQKAFGYETYEKVNPVYNGDIYDLASLTKIIGTTTAMMKLVDEGRIALDDKVGDYFPEFEEGLKSQVTIQNLLLHNSGLPPFRIYVDELQTRHELVEAVKNEPLINDPGTTYKYSDLGFILMGEIVHEVTGKRLDEYMHETFYRPLGMRSTRFNPRKAGKWIVNRIPPTERDTIYRHKTVRAQAHDERAYYMDGVAGHAGLFSSGSDIATYAQMLINKGSYGGNQYISPSTVEQFTRRQSELNNRGYGFDRKSEEGLSTAGTLASDQSFGHTGFTGTSFWVDPQRDLAIIILTNRTYPYRSYGRDISKVRADVADAVISSIIE
ncbi:glycoside hydrolase family 3 N-terminal domain-containing protein [Fodinibius sediminis]|uniref:beta-N-acetylhexosaminidase n=1 Tax=Fodinibius sediminis TaxID=1214077 RepID=A0A521D2A6_9BACT|nr:glycoside hydrolase family 3 N-terminal domain-containing protein [Fodinibius sediminis]SMO65030.1 beta-glucosidase [Fodinibius sediminis]